MGFYSRHILPHLINCACGAKPIERQRAKVAPLAEGVVLELGFGSGRNLPYFDTARVTRLIAVEPEEGMRRLSEKAAARAPFPVEVRGETAETLALAPQSVDTLFVTYTLCTIPDPVSALAACRPFLKPLAKVVFCEHGLAPDPEVARKQRNIEPLWSRIAGGCHLARDIPAIVRGAGYRIDSLEQMYLPRTPQFAGYNYWGAAGLA
jgi:SAM-dependent methyltransferase